MSRARDHLLLRHFLLTWGLHEFHHIPSLPSFLHDEKHHSAPGREEHPQQEEDAEEDAAGIAR